MPENKKRTIPFESVVAGANGSFVINDTVEHDGLVVPAFIAEEDAVITTLTGYDQDGDPVDFKTERNIVNVKAGTLHTAGRNCYFEVIELASGIIITY
jgi:hypothetical protein